MILRAATVALLPLTLILPGCTEPPGIDNGDGTRTIEVQMELPEGYPPKIGDVMANVNGKAQHWETYDYSIGAMDAAAQIRDNQGVVEFVLIGAMVGEPQNRENRLWLTGRMAGKLGAGPVAAALVEITGPDWDGPRQTSFGQSAEIVLDQVHDRQDGGYGHATGHFSAVICDGDGEPVQVDTTRCQPISGTFDTEIQFDNL